MDKQTFTKIATVIYGTIKDMGKEGISSGSLFAMTQSAVGPDVWTLSMHACAIGAMVDGKLITNYNHLLRAV